MSIGDVFRQRLWRAAVATGLAVGIALGAFLAARPPSTDPADTDSAAVKLPLAGAGGSVAAPSRPAPAPPGRSLAPVVVRPSATPVTPSPTPRPVTHGPSAATMPPLCHFAGGNGDLQLRPETSSGEDLVLFLDANDNHPCHAVVHYTFSVLDPSAPDGAPLLTATGTLDRALASSRLSIPVSSAIAVAWTNWCRAPGTYTVKVTTDANFYYPGASTQAPAPGCANKSRPVTFTVIDWLNQLDALSASVGGVNVGETVGVNVSSPTGVYAIGIDGVLFLGDPGLLGCTPTCDAAQTATLTLVTPTHARLDGDHWSIDLVAAGKVPAQARPASL